MSVPADVNTLCTLLSQCPPDVDTGESPARGGGLETAARRYGRGFAEQGYPAGSLILIAVRAASDVLALSFGAWWAGHHVTFPGSLGHDERDRLAVAAGAALQVCDPADIVDQEAVRHRDVPAVAPAELSLVPASWPAWCRPEDPALLDCAPARPSSHAALIAAARQQSRSVPVGAGDVLALPAAAGGAHAVRAAALALAAGARLEFGAGRAATVLMQAGGWVRRTAGPR
jgi:hypothetical protein